MTEVTGFSIATLLGTPVGLGTGSSSNGLPGSGHSGPRGIESVIEYNGLYLNVRDWIDTYLVTTIGGLDDADVRDSRELNPGYHGETAFPGYYGGRTITLTGKVYAKTLFKLRDMQQGLRQAFAQLDNELPLVFRTPDPNLDMMALCRKSQAIQMTDEQRTANHFERQFMVTLRASNPRFLSVVKVHSSFNFSDLYTFDLAQPPVIKETFDDPGVLNLYNARGDGFKIENGKLVSNGKKNITNLIKNPDFDAAITTHNIIVDKGRASQALTGGVDGGAYCLIDSDGSRVEVNFMDFPVNTQSYYSNSMWVRAEPGCSIVFDVEWRIGASNFWASRAVSGVTPATGAWQEIKLENMYSLGDVDTVTTAARLRLVIMNARVGAQYGIDKIMFVNGSKLPLDGYFDGSYPLARWDSNGAAYVNTSTLFPYTILTTSRSHTKPMMTAKINIAAIDAQHRWNNVDIEPEGFRIVLAYVDDDNQVYVTVKGKSGVNTVDAVLVVWRNGERETYAPDGLMNMSITNFDPGDSWIRAFMKNGEVVFQWWKLDPESGATDAAMESDIWKLTPEQSVLFEQPLPMQLVMLDEQYVESGSILQDTFRFDEMTYQSVADLPEWDYVTNTHGILNASPASYYKSALYVKNNRLYQLWNQKSFILRNDLPSLVGDGTLTFKIRYEDPIGTAMIHAGIIGKYIDENNFINADLQISSLANMTIHITAVTDAASGGFSNYLDFVKTDFPEDIDRWLRLVMNGNTFTVEFWKTDPSLGGAAAQTRAGTLTGPAAAKLGAGVKGRVGLVVSNMIPSASIDDYAVTQSSFSDTAILVNNDGNFRAQPVIELVGPLTNVVLTNEANDEVISLVAGTTIPQGETWVLDIEKRRMYRASDLANRFQYLDVNSDWMELEPGENPITMAATGMATASKVNVDFRHTVM